MAGCSGGVALGDGREGGLGFPGHVGIGVSVAVLEDLDYARTGQVEVVAGITIGTVRMALEREEEDEGAVDPLGVEDL